ncbi:MAG: twin-arginine translocation signal domain-containing protein, partial [Deltaproteobacteria bacterium]
MVKVSRRSFLAGCALAPFVCAFAP